VADDRPGGGPQKSGSQSRSNHGNVCHGWPCLPLLPSRRETGRGDYIDVGMLDVQTAMLCNQAMNYLTGARSRAGTAMRTRTYSPRTFMPVATADGARLRQ